MAKQKGVSQKDLSIVDRLGKAAGDVVDAVSVAATGSQVGVLELAAEDELGVKPIKPRKKPVVAKAPSRSDAKKRVAAKRVVVKQTARRSAKKSKAKTKSR